MPDPQKLADLQRQHDELQAAYTAALAEPDPVPVTPEDTLRECERRLDAIEAFLHRKFAEVI